VKFENVSRDDWIVAGLSLLLVIDLLFLPWFDISAGPFSVTSTATGSPDGWLGILGVLAAVALIADVAIERLSPQTVLPAISGSRAMTRFVLAGIAALFVALKFLFHVHFSLFGFGFYVAVLLAAALVYATLQVRQGKPILPGGSAGATVGPSTARRVEPAASAGPPSRADDTTQAEPPPSP
jgi:hypothetical protein